MRRNSIPIVVIDHQPYWREFATATLQAAGYAVSSYACYDEVLPPQQDEQEISLVLLGCSRLECEERLLITRLLARGQHVIVFVSSLSTQVMRVLFIRGVEDAVDRTYDPEELVDVVAQALERIAERCHMQFPIERKVYYE